MPQFVTILALTSFGCKAHFLRRAGFWAVTAASIFCTRSRCHIGPRWRPLSRSANRVPAAGFALPRGSLQHDFSAPSTSILKVARRGAVRRVVKCGQGPVGTSNAAVLLFYPRSGAAMPDRSWATEVQASPRRRGSTSAQPSMRTLSESECSAAMFHSKPANQSAGGFEAMGRPPRPFAGSQWPRIEYATAVRNRYQKIKHVAIFDQFDQGRTSDLISGGYRSARCRFRCNCSRGPPPNPDVGKLTSGGPSCDC